MSTASKAIQHSIKYQLNLVIKQHLNQHNISYHDLSQKIKIDVPTLKKIDKNEKLTFYCLFKILNELDLWFEIILKQGKK